MLLEKNRVYSLKRQPEVLVKVISLEISILGPKGDICVPAILQSSQENILIPIGMIAEVKEQTAN